MSKIKYILLFLLFSIFQLIYSKKTIMMLEGDSFDKELQNAIDAKSKLFIIFYVNNCPYCLHAIKVLKEEIINNFEDEDEINFAAVNLDKRSNIWLGVRFNIKKIPHVVLIENKRMYSFENQFESSIVHKFIEEEKDLEDSLNIPENFGMWNKVKIIMNEFTERLNKTMEIIFGKIGIKIRWTNTMSYIFLFVFLIVVIYLENQIILFIRDICNFAKKDKNDKNQDNNDNTENKDQKENVSETKDEIKNNKKQKKE